MGELVMPTMPGTGTAKLAAALAAFQADMPTIAKNKTADTGKYRYDYADLADITKAAMPLLARQGLSFSCLPDASGSAMILLGVLMHSSGESVTASLPIRGGSPQEIGSALTYMRRYLLGCMTGIVTEADDDGRAASSPKKSPTGGRSKPAGGGDLGPDPRNDGGISDKQRGMLGALMSERGITIREDALAYVESIIGHPITSRNDLTSAEASKVIDALNSPMLDGKP